MVTALHLRVYALLRVILQFEREAIWGPVNRIDPHVVGAFAGFPPEVLHLDQPNALGREGFLDFADSLNVSVGLEQNRVAQRVVLGLKRLLDLVGVAWE